MAASMALPGQTQGQSAPAWVKDAKSGCATSNPYPNPNETITWFGNCRDGKLDGRGTLVWYRDGKETERNEGTFKQGEMDGYAVTTYPEGYTVHGQYKQGQRHGQFMTVRASGDYVRATYYNGKLVDQAKLTPLEAQQWRQAGGPQLIATAAPPSEPPRQATQAALPAQQPAEEFITGRTAVASPSRIPNPRPKPAAAPPAQVAAAPAKPAGNFVLGTQVIEAIQPVGSPPAPAAAPVAAMPAPQPAAAAIAAPVAAAAAVATTATGTVVGNTAAVAAANAPPLLPAAPAPLQPAPPAAPQVAQVPAAAPAGKDAGGFYLASPSLTSPPLPGSAKSSSKSPNASAQQRYQLDQPQAPLQPAPLQPAGIQPTAQPVAPSLPGTLPTAGTIASPSLPGLPNVATAAVPLAPQPGQVNAGTGRRPPWMAPGSPDPTLIAGAPVLGQTPPPMSPTPMAGAAPLAGPAVPYVAPVYAPPMPTAAQAYQPMNPADISPTEASRQYLAQREAAQVAQSMTLPGYGPGYGQQAALPAYRAIQPSQPMAAPNMAMANTGTLTNIPSANPSAPAAIYPVGSPEAMFKDGYRLEMSGRLREAEQVYEQIILSSSNTQTAMLANDRLNNLRRNTREQSVRIAEAPRQPERQSGVVAVNEPRNLPRYAQPTGQGAGQVVMMSDSGAGDASGGMTANLTGLSVCSQRGLYDKESRWCGMVLADDGARLSVEVKDVVLPGFGNMGIQSSKCSGGTFINWFSRGSMVRVPRSCMELKG